MCIRDRHNGEQCTCGNKGCWEAYASVTALIRQTKEAMDKNPNSLMHKVAAEEGKVSGKTAFVAAKNGDKPAQEVVDEYIGYVADGIMGVINIFQPEKLVIGGGISREEMCIRDRRNIALQNLWRMPMNAPRTS